MEINLDLQVVQGRITLKGKTFEELNEREKAFMDDLLKEKKIKSESF